MNPYIGHESQLFGIEEHRLIGGKGDGMRLLEIRNGQGLEMTLVPDRACDISRLSCKGVNMSYFSPCGYVAAPYYQPTGTDWLKSFTAGFLTTCGLESVGTPCEDEGESLSLHGAIANQPSRHTYWFRDGDALVVRAEVPDEVIFGRKLVLNRELRIHLKENSFTIHDTIENTGDQCQPLEILYHMNMGYPLLDEDSIIDIPAVDVIPRNEHAAEDLDNCLKMEKPTPGYEERCYYHKFTQNGYASIFQPKLNVGLAITFDAKQLDCFVEWKMMGVRDYVLGLECGNCYPDGRNVMRKTGILKYIEPGEKKEYTVNVTVKA